MARVQKNLRFSHQVIEVLEKKASTELGMSFNEYVVYKMNQLAEVEMEEKLNNPKLALIAKNARKEYIDGKAKKISGKKDFEKLFK